MLSLSAGVSWKISIERPAAARVAPMRQKIESTGNAVRRVDRMLGSGLGSGSPSSWQEKDVAPGQSAGISDRPALAMTPGLNAGVVRGMPLASEVSFFDDGNISPQEPEEAVSRQKASPALAEQRQWIAVGSGSPGHSMVLNGQRASVEKYQQAPGSLGTGLALSITDEFTALPQTDAADHLPAPITTVGIDLPMDHLGSPTTVSDVAHDEAGQAVVDGTVTEPAPMVDQSFSSSHIAATDGLSYEQELFRTKWGWAAFDQVQRVLIEEHSE